MQTYLVTLLKRMAAVDGVEKPAAVLLDQSIVQANCNSNIIAFVMRLCVSAKCRRRGGNLVILAGPPDPGPGPYCAETS
jgi:hypothetical protein